MNKLIGYQHGVNLGGWLSQGSTEKSHLDTFITEKDIEKISSWGCDHVRLPVDYYNIENSDGTPKESGYNYIRNCVQWCRKYGLNMVLDLHKTSGYTFDDQAASAGFFDDEVLKARFLALWDNIAQRFAPDSEIIMFEPLNEVVRNDVIDQWNSLLLRCISIIHSYAPTARILLGGVGFNAPNAVEFLPELPGENIVYNFHCYEPHIFTHQTASWVDYMPQDLHIRYPGNYSEYLRLTHELTGISDHMLNCNDASVDKFGLKYFEGVFSKAVEKAERTGIPLYCGKYGVIDVAEPEDTLAWFRDIHSAFEKLGIGRAVWSYKRMGFGIDDKHYDSVRSELIKLL